MTKWFNGSAEIKEEVVIPIRERWFCPKDACGGEMIFNGMTWPAGTPGYHHTCVKCNYTVAMSGKHYPRIVYKP